jgi:hypothetical protein
MLEVASTAKGGVAGDHWNFAKREDNIGTRLEKMVGETYLATRSASVKASVQQGVRVTPAGEAALVHGLQPTFATGKASAGPL